MHLSLSLHLPFCHPRTQPISNSTAHHSSTTQHFHKCTKQERQRKTTELSSGFRIIASVSTWFPPLSKPSCQRRSYAVPQHRNTKPGRQVWAVKTNSIWVVQARPVSGFSSPGPAITSHNRRSESGDGAAGGTWSIVGWGATGIYPLLKVGADKRSLGLVEDEVLISVESGWICASICVAPPAMQYGAFALEAVLLFTCACILCSGFKLDPY